MIVLSLSFAREVILREGFHADPYIKKPVWLQLGLSHKAWHKTGEEVREIHPLEPKESDIFAEVEEPIVPGAHKRSWKKAASLLLFAALIAWLGVYISENRASLGEMFSLSWGTSTLLLALALGGCLVNCVYHRVILRTYDLPLSLTDWMGVVSVSNAISYVLPLRADLVFSAAYYKRAKGLQYTKSASMAAGNIVFGVAFSLLQILAALLCKGLLEDHWPTVLWILWALGMAAIAALIALSLAFQEKAHALFRKWRLLADVITGFNALLRNRRLLWKLLLCLTANNVFQLLLYMGCFQAAGLPITLYEALLYNSVSRLSTIVALVPGNLGITNGLMGVATLLMGKPFQSGMDVSLLQQATVMVMHLVMGLAFALPVYRRFSRESTACCFGKKEG